MCDIAFFKQKNSLQKAQREELETILKNFEDINIDNVTLLIRYSSERYIVFLDADIEVDFETTDKYDKESSDRTELLNTVYNQIEELEHSPTVQYLPHKMKMAFSRLLGNALTSALDGFEEIASQTLESAEIYLNRRSAELSRQWLLINAFVVTAVGYVIWKYFLPKEFVLFGCLGALFSILCKTGKLEYDCQAGFFLNALEVFSRYFAAVISACIAEQLYQMDLVFTSLKTADNLSSILPLICFVAGFSERLVPSIVSHLGSPKEKENCKNETQNADHL